MLIFMISEVHTVLSLTRVRYYLEIIPLLKLLADLLASIFLHHIFYVLIYQWQTLSMMVNETHYISSKDMLIWSLSLSLSRMGTQIHLFAAGFLEVLSNFFYCLCLLVVLGSNQSSLSNLIRLRKRSMWTYMLVMSFGLVSEYLFPDCLNFA